MIRHQLDARGVSCDIILVSTKAGFEAALTQGPFDLILSDYNLPGYDGVGALQHAKRVQPDAPVIIISGTVGEMLNGFQLVRLEGEGHLPAELLTLVDQMVQEAGVKLKTLGDLETVDEREMAIGMGIAYPGAGA